MTACGTVGWRYLLLDCLSLECPLSDCSSLASLSLNGLLRYGVRGRVVYRQFARAPRLIVFLSKPPFVFRCPCLPLLSSTITLRPFVGEKMEHGNEWKEEQQYPTDNCYRNPSAHATAQPTLSTQYLLIDLHANIKSSFTSSLGVVWVGIELSLLRIVLVSVGCSWSGGRSWYASSGEGRVSR